MRKRRDGAIGFSWESFNACFSFRSSADDQSCNGRGAGNTNIELIKNQLQIMITILAIVSLAGGGSLGKVEELNYQGEKEKTQPSHPQVNRSEVKLSP